jgi:hypothetical protein
MWAKNYTLAKTLVGDADDPLRPTRAALAEAGARGDTAAMRRAAEALDAGFDKLPNGMRTPAIALLQIGGLTDRAVTRISERVAKGKHAAMILLYAPPMAAAHQTPAFAAAVVAMHLSDTWRRSGKLPDFCSAAKPPALCAALGRKT